jgi:hypothetical protein
MLFSRFAGPRRSFAAVFFAALDGPLKDFGARRGTSRPAGC